MREYSVTLVFTLLLVCAAVMLALWVLKGEEIGGEGSEPFSAPSHDAVSGEKSGGAGTDQSTGHSSGNAPSSEAESVVSGDRSASVSEGSGFGDSSKGEGSDVSAIPVSFEYSFDISPYLKFIDPEDLAYYSLLVNKDTPPLRADYAPRTLVLSKNARSGREDQCYMDATAAMALEAFLKEAAFAGFPDISVTNAYRSYNTQNYLFNDYYFKMEAAANPGLSKDEVLKRVADYCFPPGQSEHQTGLCCDMHNVPVGAQERFNNSDAAVWLQENACHFGFILRYPEGKESITGAVYESWHFRFVGRTVAVYLYKNDLTLDEFYSTGMADMFFTKYKLLP